MESNTEEISLRDVLFILKKHLRLLAVTAVIFGILGLIVSKFLISPKYEADAMLIVNPGQSASATITYDQVTMTEQLAGTYAVILKSDTVLDQVITDLKLKTTTEQLAKNITVGSVNETEVIKITVKDMDAQTAVHIADDIIQVAPDLIVKTVKAGSVEVVSDAKTTGKPVSPNIPLYTAVAFLVGLVLAIMIAFVMELLNNRFSSDEDIRKYLGYSVLGVIPSYETNQKGK